MNKFGKYNNCGCNRPLNSRGICPDCVFLANHNGMNRAEYYKSRSKSKELTEKNVETISLDEETYEKVFNVYPPYCQECGRKLNEVFRNDAGKIINRSQYSHILSKKAYPEFRHNHLNFNRLCLWHHNKWEFGDKESMKIFKENAPVIEKLFEEKHKC